MFDEKNLDPDMPYQGHDPLIKVRSENQSFNKLWLKSDRKMAPIEAAGFTIFGLFFIAGGLFFAQGLTGNFMGCFRGSVSLIFLYLGIRGLINVYKSL